METVVWISGATQGLGLGFARNVPYTNARIISLSRRSHPDFETVHFDLTDPFSWDAVSEHFESVLRDFQGKRAIFIQNAYSPGPSGITGEVPTNLYRASLSANFVGPLAVGEAFIRAVRPGYEAGLVMLSSHGVLNAFEGYAAYSSAKAGIEQWVRTVHAERQWRNQGPWVVGVRPGFIDTATTRAEALGDPNQVRIVPQLKRGIEVKEALDIDTAARAIWEALPPPKGEPILTFGDQPSGS